MSDRDQLIWKLSASGTIDQIRDFLNEPLVSANGLKSRTVPSAAWSGEANAAKKLLRSRDGLAQILIIEPVGESNFALLEAVREHWAVLRDNGLADAQPVKIFAEPDGLVVYAFRWKKQDSRRVAEANDEAVLAFSEILRHGRIRDEISSADEVYQGFEYKAFPKRGGIELLRGKCTCVVELDGVPGPIELDGQNGFVIMHRGPRFKQKDSWLMPVTILEHGADTPNPWADDPRFGTYIPS